MNSSPLDPYANWLRTSSTVRWTGRVTQVVGNLVESAGPFCSVGESCEIIASGGSHFPGEIVGFRGSSVLSMTLQAPEGIRFGDQIVTLGEGQGQPFELGPNCWEESSTPPASLWIRWGSIERRNQDSSTGWHRWRLIGQ